MTVSGLLPTCVEFHHDETPESLMDRAARANSFHSISEFCSFTGTPRAGIVAMDDDEQSDIAAWTGVPEARLRKFALRGDGIVNFGHAVLRKTQLRGTSRRYCPHCFADDMESGTDDAKVRIYMRATWRFAMISSCPEHGVPLSDLPEDFDALDLRDFAIGYAPDGLPSDNSCHSRYFTGRLLGQVGTSYLDSLQLYVVAELCAVLGALQYKMVENKITEHVPLGMTNPTCLAAGYAIASNGRDAIWEFLTCFVVQMVGRAVKYPMVFSLPLRWLRNETPEGDFRQVRELFQEHAEAHLPLEAGEIFLSEVKRRRVHTAYTASKEYGLPEGRIRDILINQDSGKSVITTFKGRSVVFRRDEAHPLLAAAALKITTKDAAVRLGCAMTQMETLLSCGILQFSTNGAASGRVFRWVSVEDVAKLKERVQSKLSDITGHKHLVPILVAARACRRVFPEIVRLILDGKLTKVQMATTDFSLVDILVDPGEIDALSSAPDQEGYLGRQEAAALLGTCVETVKDLYDLGIFSVKVIPHKKTQLPMDMVRKDDLVEFLRQYVMLESLSRERRVRSIKVRMQLKRLGVLPVHEGSRNATKVYRRCDIERVHI